MKKEYKEKMEDMRVTYGMIEENYISERESRRAYGIAVYADAKNDSSAEMVAAVHDVTSDRKQMDELIEKCNRLSLSPVHLQEVIDDFLKQ